MDMISGKKMYHITYVRGSIRKYYRDQHFSYKKIDQKRKITSFPAKRGQPQGRQKERNEGNEARKKWREMRKQEASKFDRNKEL